MKRIFCIAFVCGQIAMAQQVGAVGQYLENKASFDGANIQLQMPSEQCQSVTNYRWHYDAGYTEVFLRIPQEGYFTVEVADQAISTASGKFRFFDLKSGNTPIRIYQKGFLLYQAFITTRHNTRTILDFFTQRGLFLLDVQPVGNHSYGFVSWNDVWNNPYTHSATNLMVMNQNTFADFLQTLEKEPFTTDKKTFVTSQIKNTLFTAEQIRLILRQFSFDSDRLEVAKTLYHVCYDKNNFFKVYDVFSFSSDRKKLMEYVAQY